MTNILIFCIVIGVYVGVLAWRWRVDAAEIFFKKIDVVIALGFFAVAGISEWVMGRLFTCRCGIVSLWSGDVNSSQNSQQLLDPYSFTHIIHGILFYALFSLAFPKRSMRWRLLAVLALEAFWEVLENSSLIIDRYRTATFSLSYYGDSILNSMGDIAVCLFGAWLASKLPLRYTIAIVIVIEVVLAFWIRDNLTLNIVMLLAPIQAIRRWQMGG